jgi:hypothetical protein
MPFPPRIVEGAWTRSRCFCECKRKTHGHAIPHKMRLNWENHRKEGSGKWEAYSLSGDYKEDIYDCLILCWDCYQAML